MYLPESTSTFQKQQTQTQKTAYTAQVSETADPEGIYYIGIHPMVSQAIAAKLLDKISSKAVWKSEVKINDHTRLDFVGTTDSSKKNLRRGEKRYDCKRRT